ncbi:Putative nuclease HARBI1 [Cyphomyrmex costatus]|uniref:Putative nuclease HARBI1 n=1 Tax=Cyphomyrmex costatus TaxID=456900 RepID=A0A151IK27_9HYME|nr:Putative nuclease HARBI1 [Cyphomyrmex costatus]
MVRACGVLNCTSTGNMPSHIFPINTQIREKWIKSLILKPYKENEINKLRVCYKHFKESDYIGSSKLRRLIRTAVPFMTTDTTQINNITKSQKKKVLQHHETFTVDLQRNVAQMQMNIELSEQEKQQENVTQMQIDIENLSEQEEKQQENVAQMHIDIKNLSEQEEKQQENVAQMHIDIENLSEQQEKQHENVAQVQLNIERLSRQQEKQHENAAQVQLDIERLSQQQEQHENVAQVQLNLERLSQQQEQHENVAQVQLNLERLSQQQEQHENVAQVQLNLERLSQQQEQHENVAQVQLNLERLRYIKKDKIFCLSIYRRSRRCYKFLSEFLLCPSYTTLNTQLNRIPIVTGCSNIILQYLTLNAKKMDPKDLNIILAWDEMAIKPSLTYDVKNDKIIGYEDWGITRTRRFADHAIVFYIRSLSSGQKMPIGYGFCNSATSSIQLSKCVKEWLIYLQTCGFKPKATVCDQGGPNIAAINLLIQETRAQHFKQNKNTFYVGGEYIAPLYDYVHLQKGVRNNLLNKHLLLNKDARLSERESQCASWDHIITAYEIDRKMKKLTDSHIFPSLIPKMKVKFAVQVLSHTVADFIDMILSLNTDGDLHGVSQPTVSRIVAKVSEAIAAHLPHFVRFPDRMEDLQTEFYNIAHFPQVVGCIDCTHIRIKCPNKERAMLYMNRKGFYSMNVQVVCDAQRRIRNVDF